MCARAFAWVVPCVVVAMVVPCVVEAEVVPCVVEAVVVMIVRDKRWLTSVTEREGFSVAYNCQLVRYCCAPICPPALARSPNSIVGMGTCIRLRDYCNALLRLFPTLATRQLARRRSLAFCSVWCVRLCV